MHRMPLQTDGVVVVKWYNRKQPVIITIDAEVAKDCNHFPLSFQSNGHFNESGII